MKVVILASGSKGNSIYIETSKTKILIDSGISLLQTKLRLHNQGIELNQLNGIFITHEHIDHIKYLKNIAKATNATIYLNKKTYNEIVRKNIYDIEMFPVYFINPDTKYTINDLVIVPITMSHDAVNCYGYLLKELGKENSTFATLTDTGYLNTKYFKILSSIKTILIESNHDVEMLKNSGRTPVLINRILSNKGHLSNIQCLEALKDIVSEYTETIILGHLSEDCNIPNIAYENIYDNLNNHKFKLLVAKQHEELEIIEM